MADGDYVYGSFWFYVPNKGAAVFFFIAFLVTTIAHFWQCHLYKNFSVTGLFAISGLCYDIGLVLRVIGAFGVYSELAVFIMSVCLIYAMPPLVALANYHILGRVLYYVPWLSPIHPGRVLSGFGLLSLIIEILNGIGASFTVNGDLSQGLKNLGDGMMKTSMALQLIVNGCFIALVGLVHKRCHDAGVFKRNVRQPIITLYMSTFLIMLRTIYRAVEHFGFKDLNWGELDNPLDAPAVVRYEWIFYAFEVSPMLINLVLWNSRHPRRYLPELTTKYLARDGVTEVNGVVWQDTRSKLASFLDPFDVFGMCRGRTKSRKFQLVGEEERVEIGALEGNAAGNGTTR